MVVDADTNLHRPTNRPTELIETSEAPRERNSKKMVQEESEEVDRWWSGGEERSSGGC